jgi:hypothetical protein
VIEITSNLAGKQFDLYKLEQLLKPKGFIIGGNWEYDRGFFDYKMADENGYQYLRLPFTSIDGQLDTHSCTVELGQPFLLTHVYQDGLDDHAHSDNSTATFNQFQEPLDKDAKTPDKFQDVGTVLVRELENLLLKNQ